MSAVADFIVIGAGSAGSVVAARLAEQGASVAVVEAGPSEKHPFVKMPFGLVWLMGSKVRDWALKSAPQTALGGRQINVPRGRMVGGSGSINSMVWFRGRRSDFEAWDLDGWRWPEVEAAFEAVEARLTPSQMRGAHPLTRGLSKMLGGNSDEAPTPEYESAGVFRFNMRRGARWSAADAFLRPAQEALQVQVLTGREVDRIVFEDGRAREVLFTDGTSLRAKTGVVLSAGSIGSPAILMRSGVGPAAELEALGITAVADAPEVGANLHDHPGAGLHFHGAGSGYGITGDQVLKWALAPINWLLRRKGRFASPTVEGGAFFNARGDGAEPDVQSHFIPFNLDHLGRKYARGAGYFADVCVCRPKSRGRLTLTSKDPSVAPAIDLGLFQDESDLDTLVAGLKRLRVLLRDAAFADHRAPEVFPGEDVASDAALRDFVKARCGTAYHPVGTLRIGTGTAPVSPRCKVNGVEGLWVADASVMPSITSANTNAPSMMIGHRAADFITEDCA